MKDILFTMNDITNRDINTQRKELYCLHMPYMHRYIHPQHKHMYGYHVTNESNRNYAISTLYADLMVGLLV